MNLNILARLALAELRSGLQGFRIFLACLFIGVASIASVGALSNRLSEGMRQEGQPLLGGDIEIAMPYRALNKAEEDYIRGLGKVSQVLTLRGMASAQGKAALVEVKAVDQLYPLYGQFELASGENLQALLSEGKVVVDPLLLQRLGLASGDKIKLGETEFIIATTIKKEPDLISSGFAFGPRLLLSHESLKKAALLQPGSLANLRFKIALDNSQNWQSLTESTKEKFPDSGWRVRGRDQAAPQLTRGLDQLTLFLTLAGLTTLITGGIGIANAVKAFLDGRQKTIAIFKSLGATRAQVLGIYLIEILLVASLGIAAGLIFGMFMPLLVAYLASDLLPIPIATGIAWPALLLAAIFGYLAVFAFALWPLGRAIEGPAAILLRGGENIRKQLPDKRLWLIIALCFVALSALAYFGFSARMITLYYLAGLAIAFVLLAILGQLMMKATQYIPRPRQPVFALALANLYRPGSATPAMTLALGLGLTLFVAIGQVQLSLSRELQMNLPQRAPSFFFIDVNDAIEPAFSAALQAQEGVSDIERVPRLMGRITKVKDLDASEVKPTGDGVWALRGDRGITYSQDIPENSKLVAGEWWPKNYQGPPLVSMTKDVAEGIGVTVGDQIGVNVLGREITATISSLREVEWRSLGINFVLVFDPSALAGAPKSWLMTAQVPPASEGDVLNQLALEFPAVTAVRVRDALDVAETIITGFLRGLDAGSIVTLITGTLVLMGALAGSVASRARDAVVLKTCGVTRRELIAAFAVEYALIGFVAACFALITGSLAAWAQLYWVFEVNLIFAPLSAGLTAFMALMIAILAGLMVTWRALSLPPAQILRTP